MKLTSSLFPRTTKDSNGALALEKPFGAKGLRGSEGTAGVTARQYLVAGDKSSSAKSLVGKKIC